MPVKIPGLVWIRPTDPAPPTPGQLHLWRIDLDAKNGDLFKLLSPDERERAHRFMNPRDQARYIEGRGAMRWILGHYLDTAPERLLFCYGEQGKPALQPKTEALSFNLSHSGKLALLAVSGAPAVGIDLEPLRERPNVLAITKRLFGSTLAKELSLLDPQEQSARFYQSWTRAEACLKARGESIFNRTEQPADLAVAHFIPESGWLAAVAMAFPMPSASEWSTYRFSCRVMHG